MTSADVTAISLDVPLLDADQVADLLHIRPSTVRELSRRRRNAIPSHKIGRARRYVLAEVERWVAAQDGSAASN